MKSEERRAYERAYYQANKDKIHAYHVANRDKILEVKIIYYQTHREEILERVKADSKRVRDRVMEHYGGKCACCGEMAPEFLTIDHINNNGAKHRKELGGSGPLCRWIIKNNFPPDLQILCWNCNMAKSQHGTCPHKRSQK
jgi:hypothetical protein